MYVNLVQALSNMIKGLFDLKKTQIENQTTTNIIDDKKDYKKATNISEKIIKIASKYKTKMTFSDKLKFSNLVKDFEKHN